MVQDLATRWIQSCPCETKSSHEMEKSLSKFLEPSHRPKVENTDKSMDFGRAFEGLSWKSETNGIAERAVRRVKEGTSAVLLQSGLAERWWSDSVECCCYLRNIQDLLSAGKTPYERRFGKPFGGLVIPFGSLVEYHPITAKVQSRIHQFGKKVLPGLFLGYALYAGGIWKGDVLIADLEELETMDASEIYSKRLNAKEVIFPQKGEFTFPIADGRIKTPGGDQELRTSTLIRPRPIQGEGHVDFLGESEGSFPQLMTHFRMPVKLTPSERRFGESFKGPIIPFGALIEYHPICPKDRSRIHQFGKIVLPGIFLGSELIAGGNLERRHSDCRPGRFRKS